MNLEVENDLVEMPDDTLPDVDPGGGIQMRVQA